MSMARDIHPAATASLMALNDYFYECRQASIGIDGTKVEAIIDGCIRPHLTKSDKPVDPAPFKIIDRITVAAPDGSELIVNDASFWAGHLNAAFNLGREAAASAG